MNYTLLIILFLLSPYTLLSQHCTIPKQNSEPEIISNITLSGSCEDNNLSALGVKTNTRYYNFSDNIKNFRFSCVPFNTCNNTNVSYKLYELLTLPQFINTCSSGDIYVIVNNLTGIFHKFELNSDNGTMTIVPNRCEFNGVIACDPAGSPYKCDYNGVCNNMPYCYSPLNNPSTGSNQISWTASKGCPQQSQIAAFNLYNIKNSDFNNITEISDYIIKNNMKCNDIFYLSESYSQTEDSLNCSGSGRFFCRSSCNNNGGIDPGEECDLGVLNSDDPNNNHGCSKNCTIIKGWNCSSNLAEYGTMLPASIQNIFDLLKTKNIKNIDGNGTDCTQAINVSIPDCIDYTNSFNYFFEYNSTNPVNCNGITQLAESYGVNSSPGLRTINCKQEIINIDTQINTDFNTNTDTIIPYRQTPKDSPTNDGNNFLLQPWY